MNIYVSNLSFNVQDEDLKSYFADYGDVTSAKVITDKFTNRSRGFGFVEMSSQKEANEAMQALNNKEFDGRAMSVSEAREKPARSDNKRW